MISAKGFLSQTCEQMDRMRKSMVRSFYLGGVSPAVFFAKHRPPSLFGWFKHRVPIGIFFLNGSFWHDARNPVYVCFSWIPVFGCDSHGQTWLMAMKERQSDRTMAWNPESQHVPKKCKRHRV